MLTSATINTMSGDISTVKFEELTLDDKPRLVNESLLDLLLAEVVHTVEEAAAELDMKKRSEELGASEPTPCNDADSDTNEQLTEKVCDKVEEIGYRIGLNIAERYGILEKRLNTTLSIIKFICKDIWTMLFKKQVDNLKTNHQGVYILHDNKFHWFLRISGDEGGLKTAQAARPYMKLPCGIIRGLLASFGIQCSVVAETVGLPQCTFHIKTTS